VSTLYADKETLLRYLDSLKPVKIDINESLSSTHKIHIAATVVTNQEYKCEATAIPSFTREEIRLLLSDGLSAEDDNYAVQDGIIYHYRSAKMRSLDLDAIKNSCWITAFKYARAPPRDENYLADLQAKYENGETAYDGTGLSHPFEVNEFRNATFRDDMHCVNADIFAYDQVDPHAMGYVEHVAESIRNLCPAGAFTVFSTSLLKSDVNKNCTLVMNFISTKEMAVPGVWNILVETFSGKDTELRSWRLLPMTCLDKNKIISVINERDVDHDIKCMVIEGYVNHQGSTACQPASAPGATCYGGSGPTLREAAWELSNTAWIYGSDEIHMSRTVSNILEIVEPNGLRGYEPPTTWLRRYRDTPIYIKVEQGPFSAIEQKPHIVVDTADGNYSNLDIVFKTKFVQTSEPMALMDAIETVRELELYQFDQIATMVPLNNDKPKITKLPGVIVDRWRELNRFADTWVEVKAFNPTRGGLSIQGDRVKLNYLGLSIRPLIIKDFTDPAEEEVRLPVKQFIGTIPKGFYRPNEVNEYRNPKIKDLHYCNNDVTLDNRHSTTIIPQWENIMAEVEASLVKPGIHLVAAAATTPPPRNPGIGTSINFIFKGEMPCTGWLNVVVPCPNHIATTGRCIRLAPLIFGSKERVYRLVAGRQQDASFFRQHTSAVENSYTGREGGEVIENCLHHYKRDGQAPIYLNNCTGRGGVIRDLQHIWAHDIENYAWVYGTDEGMLSRFANNVVSVMSVPTAKNDADLIVDKCTTITVHPQSTYKQMGWFKRFEDETEYKPIKDMDCDPVIKNVFTNWLRAHDKRHKLSTIKTSVKQSRLLSDRPRFRGGALPEGTILRTRPPTAGELSEAAYKLTHSTLDKIELEAETGKKYLWPRPLCVLEMGSGTKPEEKGQKEVSVTTEDNGSTTTTLNVRGVYQNRSATWPTHGKQDDTVEYRPGETGYYRHSKVGYSNHSDPRLVDLTPEKEKYELSVRWLRQFKKWFENLCKDFTDTDCVIVSSNPTFEVPSGYKIGINLTTIHNRSFVDGKWETPKRLSSWSHLNVPSFTGFESENRLYRFAALVCDVKCILHFTNANLLVNNPILKDAHNIDLIKKVATKGWAITISESVSNVIGAWNITTWQTKMELQPMAKALAGVSALYGTDETLIMKHFKCAMYAIRQRNEKDNVWENPDSPMMMAWHLFSPDQLRDTRLPPSFKRLMSVDATGHVVAGKDIPSWLAKSFPTNILQTMAVCFRLHRIMRQNKLTNQGMVSYDGTVWPRTGDLIAYLLNQGPKPTGNPGESTKFFPHPDGGRLVPPIPDFLKLDDDFKMPHRPYEIYSDRCDIGNTSNNLRDYVIDVNEDHGLDSKILDDILRGLRQYEQILRDAGKSQTFLTANKEFKSGQGQMCLDVCVVHWKEYKSEHCLSQVDKFNYRLRVPSMTGHVTEDRFVRLIPIVFGSTDIHYSLRNGQVRPPDCKGLCEGCAKNLLLIQQTPLRPIRRMLVSIAETHDEPVTGNCVDFFGGVASAQIHRFLLYWKKVGHRYGSDQHFMREYCYTASAGVCLKRGLWNSRHETVNPRVYYHHPGANGLHHTDSFEGNTNYMDSDNPLVKYLQDQGEPPEMIATILYLCNKLYGHKCQSQDLFTDFMSHRGLNDIENDIDPYWKHGIPVNLRSDTSKSRQTTDKERTGALDGFHNTMCQVENLQTKVSKQSWEKIMEEFELGDLVHVSKLTIAEKERIANTRVNYNAYRRKDMVVIPLLNSIISRDLMSGNDNYWANDHSTFKFRDKNESRHFMLNFQLPKEESKGLQSWAVAIPAGEGKTTFLKKYPQYADIIIDQDDIEDRATVDKLIEADDWEQLNVYHQSHKVGPNKIVLTWGKSTKPCDTDFKATLMLRKKPLDLTKRRSEYNTSNRLALELSGQHLTKVETRDDIHKALLNLIKTFPTTGRDYVGKYVKGKRDFSALEMLTIVDVPLHGLASNHTIMDHPMYAPRILNLPTNTKLREEKTSPEEEDFENIVMYEDNDLSWTANRIMLPTTGRNRTRENPDKVINSMKMAFTKRPMYSRPVLTKMLYAELNAVNTRLQNVVSYRKVNINPRTEGTGMMDAVGVRNWREESNKFSPITYDSAIIREWLQLRTGVAAIDKELDLIEDEGLAQHPLNKLNVHVKLESLLKSQPVKDMAKLDHRIIVWQAKGICAIFAGIFLEAKHRLKQLLRPEVLYADGYTPAELSQRVRLIKEQTIYFVEDDLTKQDKQTDEQTLAVEMWLYANVLKVKQEVVQLWAWAHINWTYKGMFVKGTLNAMRQTGQATTALGNLIVNLLAHWRVVKRLGRHMLLMLALGDDNLIITTKRVDPRQIRKEIRDYYNMESKTEINSQFGVFLQLLCYKGPLGMLEFGPDIMRISRRYEFTNGVSEATDNNVSSRRMAYLFMLGKSAETEVIARTINKDIELPDYYDIWSAMAASATRHEATMEDAIEQRSKLVKALRENQVWTYNWLHYSSSKI